MKLKILLTLLALLSCEIQLSTPVWQKAFYGDNASNAAKEVLIVENGESIIVLGIKINYKINKEQSSYALLKLDKYGNVLNELKAGKENKIMTSIEKNKDKLILIGCNGQGATNTKLWIQIVDLNFNIIKDKIFNNIPINSAISPKIKTDKDGNYIVSLSPNKYLNQDGYNLIKFDKDLNIIWEKEFMNEFNNSNSYNGLNIEDFTFDENNNIIMTGTGNPFYNTDEKFITDLFVIKTDSNGNKLWRKTIGNSNTRYYGHSITAFNNEYYIAGRIIEKNKNNPNNNKIDIIYSRLSTKGDIIFNKKFGGTKADFSTKILSKGDGTFYIIGVTNSNTDEYSKNNGKSDNLILKVNANGNRDNIQIFGDKNSDSIYDIEFNSKLNTYVLVGHSMQTLNQELYGEWKIYSMSLN